MDKESIEMIIAQKKRALLQMKRNRQRKLNSGSYTWSDFYAQQAIKELSQEIIKLKQSLK